jgi:hypothetical protein
MVSVLYSAIDETGKELQAEGKLNASMVLVT